MKKMTKRNAFRLGVVILVIIGIITVHIRNVINKEIETKNLLYCQEYIPGTKNIQGDVGPEYYESKSKNFAIGANAYGFAVFKDPDAALKELKKEYPDTIALIKKEFHLAPPSKENFEDYKSYSEQVISENDEELKRLGFVAAFFDIYENSYIMQ